MLYVGFSRVLLHYFVYFAFGSLGRGRVTRTLNSNETLPNLPKNLPLLPRGGTPLTSQLGVSSTPLSVQHAVPLHSCCPHRLGSPGPRSPPIWLPSSPPLSFGCPCSQLWYSSAYFSFSVRSVVVSGLLVCSRFPLSALGCYKKAVRFRKRSCASMRSPVSTRMLVCSVAPRCSTGRPPGARCPLPSLFSSSSSQRRSPPLSLLFLLFHA